MSVPLPTSKRVLVAALVALAVLYAAWFGTQPDPWVALVVFALPPTLLAVAVLRRSRTAGFWSAVIALAWFSHGVMVAWERPDDRLQALLETALAVIVVFSASMAGLKARFSRKRG
ncbi:DUF2069 domain-containing protein [Novilysobacter spongiicola]|uniref:Predicted membrane protein n=1 Tax=Lysobacter spongiicola DSM 21749 TaxID=1122188 RepID=A0A1T4R180_9GAMM|nr:DUF2069 domain-containing protein [Lysobacter spongiicola]SKA09740.1 Predicted membrane protein [Lysobacter spongiicola DSM 21749]